jgi:hypothetical protein
MACVGDSKRNAVEEVTEVRGSKGSPGSMNSLEADLRVEIPNSWRVERRGTSNEEKTLQEWRKSEVMMTTL